MIIQARSFQSLLLLLLIAAALPSCKSPTAPVGILSNPTLSVTAPDSALVFDTVTFHGHYSDSIKPTWYYAWQFGDSTKASTRDTSISHIYDSAGTYTVQVNLTDTILHQTIAKQTAQIKIMLLNAPTLTLTVPDTNYWGDSCVMNVSSSQQLKPSWIYTWTFGDSTSLTSKQNTVQHYFATSGTMIVRVALNDTVHHILLASQTAMISVAARNFNLALLQSMTKVDFGYQARISLSSTGGGDGPCGVTPGPTSLLWNSANFSMSSIYNYSSPESTKYMENDTEYGVCSINGTMNNDSSGLDNFSWNVFYTSQDFNYVYNSGCYTTYDNFFDADAVPFLKQSDTDVIFEARDNLTKNAREGDVFSGAVPHTGQFSVDDTAVFSDPSVDRYVIIRFHK